MQAASEQKKRDMAIYRQLTTSEINILIENGNTAEDWQDVFISEEFDPEKIKYCSFYGKVYIGNLNKGESKHRSITLPVGLYRTVLCSCQIGNDVAIHNIGYLHNYKVEDEVILFNIDEISSSENAAFGMKSDQRGENNWLEIGNENGGRKISPFPGMLPADAQLWSRYGIKENICKSLIKFSDRQTLHKNGFHAIISSKSIIKNTKTIYDVNIGKNSFITGCISLKNSTIHSNKEEPTVIEDGVIISNSVIGFSNNIKRNVIVDHVYTCRNVQLENGLRIFHSFVSPNSTIACGEITNNLLLPFHEQHHNNSFLIASTLLGQSNIAAGATIGSNHNSRAADGEILAERGFWPGLCSNFKHNSYFSHFSLIAKGNYDSELNIKLPFSLISINPVTNEIQIMPGYWFKYNMYALGRNSWKFKKRDQRKIIDQYIETDYLAPDTVQSMLAGITLLMDDLRRSNKKNHINR